MHKYVAEEAHKKVWHAYTGQKGMAKTRGIRWNLTFEEWCDIWFASGKWAERGKGGNQYCMARKHDEGSYSVDNVVIITNRENMREKTPARWRNQYGEGKTKNTAP
jgi:hypothetical protein